MSGMRTDPNVVPRGGLGATRFRGLGGLVAIAWLLSLGVDFFLHAGLLARLYTATTPFLLEAGEAFRRIPLGYVGFLVLTWSLAWAIERLDIRGGGAGFRFGLIAGVVIWGALALGLYSVSTAPVALLLGWWIGQALELALAGAVVGAGLAGTPRRRLLGRVLLVVLLLVVATVVLQSLGLAPAMRIEG